MISNAQEIISNADILTVVSSRTPVKPAGGSRYQANCPIHSGTGWSLSIQPDKNLWYCFSSCRSGGGPLEFICALEKLDPREDFAEAVELLAKETGQVCHYDQEKSKNGTPEITRESLYNAITKAAEHYTAELQKDTNSHALEYAHQRGLSDELIKSWQIGYARGSQVSECGADPDHLVAAGVLKRPKDPKSNLYDPLAGRLIIPLRNPAGRIVAFIGRLIPSGNDNSNEKRAPYINTAETAIYKKGTCLFGFHQAKALKKDECYIMEGQLKVIAAQNAGFQAVAPGGTALTDRQATLAARLSHNIHLAYDNDKPGRKAAMGALYTFRAMEIIPDVARLDSPEDTKDGSAKLDPDDLLARGLPIKYSTTDWLSWILHACNVHPDQEPDPVEAAQTIHKFILPILAEHPAPAVRAAERNHLSQLAGLPVSSLEHPNRKQGGTSTQQSKKQTKTDTAFNRKMTPGRLLCAALLQANIRHDNITGGALWWRHSIDFLHIPTQLISVIQEIARIKQVMEWNNLSLADAIEHAAAACWRETFRYWAAVELPGAPDDRLLAQLNTTVRNQHLAQHTEKAKKEVQSDRSPAWLLKYTIQEKTHYGQANGFTSEEGQ